MCQQRWVPSEADNPYRDFTWWNDGITAPYSSLQVDGNTPTKRILGPDGKPVKQHVHAIGFQPEMIER